MWCSLSSLEALGCVIQHALAKANETKRVVLPEVTLWGWKLHLFKQSVLKIGMKFVQHFQLCSVCLLSGILPSSVSRGVHLLKCHLPPCSSGSVYTAARRVLLLFSPQWGHLTILSAFLLFTLCRFQLFSFLAQFSSSLFASRSFVSFNLSLLILSYFP